LENHVEKKKMKAESSIAELTMHLRTKF
jgi:hypothetical protein